MKTWQAALAHIGLSTLQGVAAVSFFDPNTPVGMLGNTQVQITAQVGLAALQAWVARINSNTDPKGNVLAKAPSGQFVSVKE